MSRCLTLAKKGLGHVSPNPLVGCVVVYDGRIISEGFHKQYGGPHAEVNAINALEEHEILKSSTIYVNLEPCAHQGKTPPCASLLIEKQVSKVVIGMKDPYHEVSGKGIQMLLDAGIEVETGVLEKSCIELNKRFICNQNQKRPYVILKWAESLDGFIGQEEKIQISGLKAQTILHEWRTQEDAFMIGTNTLIKDNPKLSVRLVEGRQPIRVAIDFYNRTREMSLNFKDGSQKTILLNHAIESVSNNIQYAKIKDKSPRVILDKLWELNIGSVVVEGGAQLLNSFIAAGIYDEIRVFKSKSIHLNQGIKAPQLDLDPKSEFDLENDFLISY